LWPSATSITKPAITAAITASPAAAVAFKSIVAKRR